MLENFVKEATALANKPELTAAEHRRFSFLLTTIVQLRGGKTMDAINDAYRNEQLVRLGAQAPAGSEVRRQQERNDLLEKFKQAHLNHGQREKLLKILRPDLALSY